MATNKDLKRWYTGEGNSPKDFVRLNEEGKVDDDLIPGSGGSEGLIIEASANKTVNNYQVPQLTDEQLLQIYNAVVAGKPVTVTDATGSMHFSSLNADSVSGEIFVTMLYFDKMILEYAEGDQTTFTEIGGGKLYRHAIVIDANSNGSGSIVVSVVTSATTPFSSLYAFSDYLKSCGYSTIKKMIPATGIYMYNQSPSGYYVVCGIGYGSFGFSVATAKIDSPSTVSFNWISVSASYGTITDTVTEL